MATIKKYNGSTWENAVVRKYGTASEIITPPTTIYADGSNITTYTIKGNTVQDGTPTPLNPVTVNGVGELTDNLMNVSMSNVVFYNDYPSSTYNNFTINNNAVTLEANKAAFFALPAKVEENTTYYVRAKSLSGSGFTYRVRYYSDLPNNRSDNFISSAVNTTIVGTYTNSITTPQGCKYILTELYHDPSQGERTVGELMVSSSSDYEPYGFKIPISSAQGTTNIYLNEPLYKIGDYADTINSDGTITRQIKKINLGDKNYTITANGNYTSTLGDGVIVSNNIIAPALCTDFQVVSAQNYASTAYSSCAAINLTSAISINKTGYEGMTEAEFKAAMNGKYLYYALATPITEQITLPSIPTTDGANSITVDTTVQPSEFTATWTGWHDSSVKEWDGTDWQ